MIKDDENYYNQTNFVRDDWGGQVMIPNASRKAELTDDNMVNGSNNKPFPTEANFVQGSGLDGYANNSNPAGIAITDPSKQYAGQVKYARREGAPSAYKDATRYTADDRAAAVRAEKDGSIFEPEIEEEEGDAGL